MEFWVEKPDLQRLDPCTPMRVMCVIALNQAFPNQSEILIQNRDENYWDNYPSAYNKTITPDKIKQLIGRILQYGYTGQVSASWSSVNGDDLANVMATQMLIWEVIVGERDESFNKVGTGSKHAVFGGA